MNSFLFKKMIQPLTSVFAVYMSDLRFAVSVALILMTIFAFAADIQAANGKKPTALWQETGDNGSARNKRESQPEKYRVFRLNQAALQDLIESAPLANTDAARRNETILSVPMPDGTIARFRVEESPVLSPELSAEFPSWKTLQGFGIDDPTATARFDWNALGFHGFIESRRGTVYIDPYRKGDTQNYLVFNKHEYGQSDNAFSCRVEGDLSKELERKYKMEAFVTPEFNFGANVRTYRIAIATTGEWARNAAGFNGTQTPIQIRTGALGVIVTTVNRLNGIYTRELASNFQLVNPTVSNNATNIIFDDPATDPYANTDDAAQLNINQMTITSRRGTANYDIGHLYGTGGGGVAASPSLCDDTAKAQGYSARGTNTGDPFTVDYVAHEIGHQFGANHTYNNSDPSGACTTRSAANAFEVASGATLMSYVGICEQRNLQQYVDTGFPSFHIRSLTEINTNITTGDPSTTGCGTANGSNAIPAISAGAAFTVPRLTPFTLTASGSDTDAGDVPNLLYSWEEYDLATQPSGALGTPAGTYDVDTDGVLRPLFRAYSPVSGNTRTFPSLPFILNPAGNDPAGSNQPQLTYTGTHPTGFSGAVCEASATCVVGERLPTVNRTMNFRVSVRDRRGGVGDAGTTVTVAAGAGPFQITAQNSRAAFAPADTWQANTSQPVTWDVANTNAAPVNAANVNILLSTDGGLTFPITLAANTPNDGSQSVTVPNNPTTTARIKVEAVGNIFFDINNVNFTITGPTAASVSVAGRVFSQGLPIANAVVTLADQNGNARIVRTSPFGYYLFQDVGVGHTYVFSVSAKRHRFDSQVITVNETLETLDFTAQ